MASPPIYEDISIAASSKVIYDFRSRTDGSQRLFPYGKISLFNTGATSIKVYINDSQSANFMPSGTILELEHPKEIPGKIYKVVVENASSAAAATFTMRVQQ